MVSQKWLRIKSDPVRLEKHRAISRNYVRKKRLELTGRKPAVYGTDAWRLEISRGNRSAKTYFTPSKDIGKVGYLAGLLDGEGSIIYHSRQTDQRYGQWMIEIANNSQSLIEWLTANFGGHAQEYFQKRPWSARYHIRRWRLGGKQDVLTFLELVLPFLVIKREKAENAIKDLRKRLPVSA
jgi:hypothetical protein